MTLKELALCVHETLDANKDKWGLVACEPQYLLTYEEAEKQFAWAGEIDEKEIENINAAYWEAGIQTRDFMEVARAIAIILEARCVTKEDRDEKHEWLSSLNEKAAETVRRINRREPPNEKKHEKEWRFGEFTKFDFIKTYGYLYDSEEEANADANDKAATCPALMGLLNAGWLNFEAKETDGKIIIRARDPKCSFSPSSMLAAIKIAFETMVERHHYKETKKGIQNAFLLYSLSHWRHGVTMPSVCGANLPNGCGPHELLDFIETFMMDEESFPQEVFDFKTLNRKFVLICKQIVNTIDSMDETMEDIVKQLYLNTFDNMNTLADVECRILREQQERDPVTKKFIKPSFKIENLVYTITLATLLFYLDMKFDRIMRVDQCFSNRLNRPYYDWEKQSGHNIEEMIQRQYLVK